MKLKSINSALIAISAALVLSGCGSDDDTVIVSPELELSGKSLVFYSTSTDEQYAYNVDAQTITNLQNATDAEGEDISNFNMDAANDGKMFIWIDNKGDSNASNDEEKVIMFNQDYSYADDGNATWEDFYYLGHYHAEEEDGETHYHLAAHSNDEFNVTSGAKFAAMNRLNAYLASEAITEANLTTALNGTTTLCGFKSVTNDNGTHHYAMGVDGTLYIYDNTFSIVDTVVVTDSCEVNKMGISAVSHHDENGVVIFESNSQKLYLVDSHDDGIFHVHSSYNLSELLGSGKSAEMMVSLVPVGYEPDEDEHEH